MGECMSECVCERESVCEWMGGRVPTLLIEKRKTMTSSGVRPTWRRAPYCAKWTKWFGKSQTIVYTTRSSDSAKSTSRNVSSCSQRCQLLSSSAGLKRLASSS